MNIWLRPKHLGMALATTLAISGSLLYFPAAQAQEAILERDGNLQSAQGEHTFSGTAGQAVVITLTSTDFDTTLSLVGPNGEEIASNDDYGNSLNSTIVTTLPSNGAYQIFARSFSGIGGDYTVSVKVATPYDQAYARGATFLQQGNYSEAIAAYNEAIALDPDQPTAYQELANAIYGQAQQLQPGEREAIINNYERALELYEEAGNTDAAQMLRDQLLYLQPQ